jgi:hypothetical protein
MSDELPLALAQAPAQAPAPEAQDAPQPAQPEQPDEPPGAAEGLQQVSQQKRKSRKKLTAEEKSERAAATLKRRQDKDAERAAASAAKAAARAAKGLKPLKPHKPRARKRVWVAAGAAPGDAPDNNPLAPTEAAEAVAHGEAHGAAHGEEHGAAHGAAHGEPHVAAHGAAPGPPAVVVAAKAKPHKAKPRKAGRGEDDHEISHDKLNIPVRDFKVGDIISEVSYYRVSHVSHDRLDITPLRGPRSADWSMGCKEFACAHSTRIIGEPVLKTKTDLVQLLHEHVRNDVFRITFAITFDAARLAERLLAGGDIKCATEAEAKAKATEMMEHDLLRTFDCRLLGAQNLMGYSLVDVLTTGHQTKPVVRTINHRDIKEIIWNNTRYVLKGR